MPTPKKPLIIGLFILIFILLASAPAIYYYQKYQTLQTQVGEKDNTDSERKELIAKISSHIRIPTGEEPVILTVTDKERLSGQEFFAYAKNGDKVLVFELAKKAFLYDPIADLVLEVGPVLASASAVAQEATGSATTAPAQEKVTFYLYNGTTTVGLTKRFETMLLAKIPDAVVIDRDNAKSQTYEKSILVDLGTKSAQAEDIATALGITLDTLPAGETKPAVAADFLIILGKDAQ